MQTSAYIAIYTFSETDGFAVRSFAIHAAIQCMWKQSTMAKIVPIRFSDEVYARYEAMAAQALPEPLPVSTYLKKRLAAGDDTAEAMLMLRQSIDDLAEREVQPGTPDASQADTPKMLLEILLLLRAVANPQHVRGVHSELQRIGVGVWRGQA